jgi:hypothetical protein
MQAKWDEMFGEKEEEVVEVKVKKPRRKTMVKKPAEKKGKAKASIKHDVKDTKRVTTKKKII